MRGAHSTMKEKMVTSLIQDQHFRFSRSKQQRYCLNNSWNNVFYQNFRANLNGFKNLKSTE